MQPSTSVTTERCANAIDGTKAQKAAINRLLIIGLVPFRSASPNTDRGPAALACNLGPIRKRGLRSETNTAGSLPTSNGLGGTVPQSVARIATHRRRWIARGEHSPRFHKGVRDRDGLGVFHDVGRRWYDAMKISLVVVGDTANCMDFQAPSSLQNQHIAKLSEHLHLVFDRLHGTVDDDERIHQIVHLPLDLLEMFHTVCGVLTLGVKVVLDGVCQHRLILW
jgi:hypothetical protein